jgi:hypothetical protein
LIFTGAGGAVGLACPSVAGAVVALPAACAWQTVQAAQPNAKTASTTRIPFPIDLNFMPSHPFLSGSFSP